MPTGQQDRRLRPLVVGGMLLGYVIVFAVASTSWWTHARTSLPLTTHLYDAHLIVWVLAWVSHALRTSPGDVFNANINWPAPAQLTGSEHFLSHQMFFSPLAWATGDPILSANVTTWLWYPIGATLLAALALRCGARPLVAWTCGCFFALGPLRVPFSLQTLQYPNAVLPVLALAVARLREHPTGGRALALLAAALVTFLTSLYAAVLGVVGALLWSVVELMRPLPSRGRFILHGGAAGMAAGLVAAAVLTPYLSRAAIEPSADVFALPVAILLWGTRWDELAVVVLGSAAWMVVAPRGPARRLLGAGTFIVVAAAVILLVQPWIVGTAAASALSFVQGWHRFSVLGGFGTALLAAGALQGVYARWGSGAGRLAVAVFFLCIVMPRMGDLMRFKTYDPPSLNERANVYRGVSSIVSRDGPGPLLELPLIRPGVAADAPRRPLNLEPDSMLGSTLHWLPLVGGFTRYYPQHRRVIVKLVRHLPAAEAFQDLVDITHLDWILLRPENDWSSRVYVREKFRHSPFVGVSHEIDGFTLLRVEREPRDDHWIDSIRTATTSAAASSALGTPLRGLAESEAVAAVSASATPTTVVAGRRVRLMVTIQNTGTTDWPVTRPAAVRDLAIGERRHRGRFVVHLQETWEPHGATPMAAPPAPVEHLLRRDIRAGESIRQMIVASAPSRPGTYVLVLRVTQSEGAEFVVPPSAPFRRRYRIGRPQPVPNT